MKEPSATSASSVIDFRARPAWRSSSSVDEDAVTLEVNIAYFAATAVAGCRPVLFAAGLAVACSYESQMESTAVAFAECSAELAAAQDDEVKIVKPEQMMELADCT